MTELNMLEEKNRRHIHRHKIAYIFSMLVIFLAFILVFYVVIKIILLPRNTIEDIKCDVESGKVCPVANAIIAILN